MLLAPGPSTEPGHHVLRKPDARGLDPQAGRDVAGGRGALAHQLEHPVRARLQPEVEPIEPGAAQPLELGDAPLGDGVGARVARHAHDAREGRAQVA